MRKEATPDAAAHTKRLAVMLVAMALAVQMAGAVGFAWLGGPPWAANHFGFALPGDNGLPYRIHFSGRDYATQGYCAGADWCKGQQRECDAKQHIFGADSLSHVADVKTLLGPDYPIYTVSTAGFTTVILYVKADTCYVPYALEGGP